MSTSTPTPGGSASPTGFLYQVEEWNSDQVQFPGPATVQPAPAVGCFIWVRRLQSDGSPADGWEPAWTWVEQPSNTDIDWTLSTDGVIVFDLPPRNHCTWLPPNWPAHHFPLGLTIEHLRVWSDHVRGVLSAHIDSPNTTVRADDPAHGWLAATRAVYALAHHLDVIGPDRLLEQEPSSPAEASRIVEPLLRGILNAGIRNSPLPGATPATPPNAPDRFAGLRAAATELRLIGNEQAIIEELCKGNGRVSLANLAALFEWSVPYDGAWNAARGRLNKKLKKYGWLLGTHDRKAVAKPPKTSALK